MPTPRATILESSPSKPLRRRSRTGCSRSAAARGSWRNGFARSLAQTGVGSIRLLDERMVEIQRSKGIDARVGDVQDLPFGDAEFDVVVAAWMLYHLPDLDRGLAEIARVLKAGGRLVAVTNAIDHLRELWELAGRETSIREFTFHSENGEEALRRHFASVTRREAHGWTTMDEDAVRRFGASWEDLGSLATAGPFDEPLRVRRHSTIFIAETA